MVMSELCAGLRATVAPDWVLTSFILPNRLDNTPPCRLLLTSVPVLSTSLQNGQHRPHQVSPSLISPRNTEDDGQISNPGSVLNWLMTHVDDISIFWLCLVGSLTARPRLGCVRRGQTWRPISHLSNSSVGKYFLLCFTPFISSTTLMRYQDIPYRKTLHHRLGLHMASVPQMEKYSKSTQLSQELVYEFQIVLSVWIYL